MFASNMPHVLLSVHTANTETLCLQYVQKVQKLLPSTGHAETAFHTRLKAVAPQDTCLLPVHTQHGNRKGAEACGEHTNI